MKWHWLGDGKMTALAERCSGWSHTPTVLCTPVVLGHGMVLSWERLTQHNRDVGKCAWSDGFLFFQLKLSDALFISVLVNNTRGAGWGSSVRLVSREKHSFYLCPLFDPGKWVEFLQKHQEQTSQVVCSAFIVTFLIMVAMFLLNHLKIKAAISKRNPKRIVPNYCFLNQ